MITLTEIEALSIMSSDMKLWEIAETKEPEPGVLVKRLALPWGIGETEIRLEGITDAIKRRGAVQQYADYIRNLIKDKTDDEAVEARAKQAAARLEPLDSGGSILTSSGRVPSEGVEEAFVPGTGDIYQDNVEGDGGFGANLIAQRSALQARVGRAEADITAWRRTLRALDAACLALEEEEEDEGRNDDIK